MWPNAAISSRLWGDGSSAISSHGRDFHRENVKRIKSLQRDVRDRQQRELQIKAEAKLKSKRPLKAIDRRPLVDLSRSSPSKKPMSDFLHGHAKTGPFVALTRSKSLNVVSENVGTNGIQSNRDDEFPDEEEIEIEEETESFEPRFNDISTEQRREKISEMIQNLLQIAPLVDGQRRASPRHQLLRPPTSSSRMSPLSRSSSMSRLRGRCPTTTREKSVQTVDRRIPP